MEDKLRGFLCSAKLLGNFRKTCGGLKYVKFCGTERCGHGDGLMVGLNDLGGLCQH